MDALSDAEIEQLITEVVKNNPSMLEPDEKYILSSDMSDAEIAERINTMKNDRPAGAISTRVRTILHKVLADLDQKYCNRCGKPTDMGRGRRNNITWLCSEHLNQN